MTEDFIMEAYKEFTDSDHIKLNQERLNNRIEWIRKHRRCETIRLYCNALMYYLLTGRVDGFQLKEEIRSAKYAAKLVRKLGEDSNSPHVVLAAITLLNPAVNSHLLSTVLSEASKKSADNNSIGET